MVVAGRAAALALATALLAASLLLPGLLRHPVESPALPALSGVSPLLTAAASALAGHATPVHCGAMPGYPWADSVAGRAAWTVGTAADDRVYLRYCGATLRLERPYVDVFAHELLHIEHKGWPHPRVYAAEHAYGAVVLEEVRRLR